MRVPQIPLSVAMLVIVMVLASGCGPTAAPAETKATPTQRPAATQEARLSPTSQPPPAKPSARVGTALEWYSLAEKEAKAWQTDALLRSVVGGNIAMDGSSLPCDGKAELWTYYFVSVAARKNLIISVRNGAISSKSDTALTNLSGQPISDKDLEQLYFQLYPVGDWKVDSTRAAETANALFKAKYNVEPRSISYVMFNTKYLDFLNNKTINWMYWVLSYDPEKYPYQVTMDARTGEVKQRP